MCAHNRTEGIWLFNEADGLKTSWIARLQESASAPLPPFLTPRELVWLPKFKGTAAEPPCPPPLLSLSLSLSVIAADEWGFACGF